MPYDAINPKHYNTHPSGIECITITEHMGFCLGNAMKYIWRADEKGNAIEDMEKAKWYIEREIARRKAIGEDVNEFCEKLGEPDGPKPATDDCGPAYVGPPSDAAVIPCPPQRHFGAVGARVLDVDKPVKSE